MKPILLAIDGSETAAEATGKAIELAGALGAPLVVASIWDIAYEPMGYGIAPVIPDLDFTGRDNAEEVAEKAADEARGAGVDVETVVRRGLPTQEICAIADQRDVQLTVLGSHGWGAFRRMMLGSVSIGVLHHAKQPVLIVRGPAAEEQPQKQDTRVEAEV